MKKRWLFKIKRKINGSIAYFLETGFWYTAEKQAQNVLETVVVIDSLKREDVVKTSLKRTINKQEKDKQNVSFFKCCQTISAKTASFLSVSYVFIFCLN